MNVLKITAICLFVLFSASKSYAQDDRNFWQKLFGKKSEQIDVEEPKNSQDSLAALINNHLDVSGATTEVDSAETAENTKDALKTNPQSSSTGKLDITMDETVKIWLDTVSKTEPVGFRIQVFMGDLTEARGIRARLLSDGERATIDYNVADYIVRIGDFRSYMEAEKKLAAIRNTYPGAYVVKDKIKL